jgi:hypothetical protein
MPFTHALLLVAAKSHKGFTCCCVAAACTAAALPLLQSPKYGSLSTNELKEVCKERGLSAKGQVRRPYHGV